MHEYRYRLVSDGEVDHRVLNDDSHGLFLANATALLQREVIVVEHVFGAFEELTSGGGKRNLGIPIDQGESDFLFEFGNVLAQARLRHVEKSCRCTEVEMLRELDILAQDPDIHCYPQFTPMVLDYQRSPALRCRKPMTEYSNPE